MTDFFLRRGSETREHLSEDDVRTQYCSSLLERDWMSWKPGETQWTSLGKRWPVESRPSVLLIVGARALLIGGFAFLFWLGNSFSDVLPLEMQSGASVVALLIMAAAAVVIGAVVSAVTTNRRVGRQTVSSVLCSVAAVLGLVVCAVLSAILYPVMEVRRLAADAAINYSEDAHEIQIKGRIGRRFTADFLDTLAQHPAVARVVINSEGGFATDAIKVARAVQSKALPVRIDGQCASACVLVWAASPSREITSVSKVGLHATALRGAFSPVLRQFVIDRLNQHSVEILKSAGFSEASIEKANATPPEKMWWLTPLDLEGAGATAHIVGERGETVGADMAMWQYAAKDLRRGGWGPSLWDIIAFRIPQFAQTHASELYYAVTGGNPDVLNKATNSLSAQARSVGIRFASDDGVVAWNQALLYQVDSAIKRKDPTVCGILSGRQTDQKGNRLKLSKEDATATTSALKELILSIPMYADISRQSPVSTMYTYTHQTVLSNALAQTTAAGVPADKASWDDSQRCTYLHYYAESLHGLDAHTEAEVIRVSADSTGKKSTTLGALQSAFAGQ